LVKTVILEDSLSYVLDYEMILDKLDVKVENIFKSWKQALASVKGNPPDFMIVDLLLEHNENALDFIEEIKNLFIPIIVCTGYPEKDFSDRALNSEVVAFFSKPLDKPALSYAIRKLIKDIIQDKTDKRYLILKEKGSMIKVPYNRIIKIQIDGNYSYVFTNTGKKFIQKLSLKKLMERLDESIFQRCHRSTVVNRNFVSKLHLGNNQVELSTGEMVDLGRNFKSSIKDNF